MDLIIWEIYNEEKTLPKNQISLYVFKFGYKIHWTLLAILLITPWYTFHVILFIVWQSPPQVEKTATCVVGLING